VEVLDHMHSLFGFPVQNVCVFDAVTKQTLDLGKTLRQMPVCQDMTRYIHVVVL
jgi:hypothetical protein